MYASTWILTFLAKSKGASSTAKSTNEPSGSRQTTLFGLKKGSTSTSSRPSLPHASSTETEGDGTMGDVDESDMESMPVLSKGLGGLGNGVMVEETQLVDEPEQETQLDERDARGASPDWEDGDGEETYL